MLSKYITIFKSTTKASTIRTGTATKAQYGLIQYDPTGFSNVTLFKK